MVEAAKKKVRKAKNQRKAFMRYICKRALFAFDTDTIDHRERTATADNIAYRASLRSAQIPLRETSDTLGTLYELDYGRLYNLKFITKKITYAFIYKEDKAKRG